jgi:hypothetical protein
MNADALPYALLIVLIEFTVGSLWVLGLSHARGNSTPSFLKVGAAITCLMALITFWVAALVNVEDEVDGYPLDADWISEARWAMAAVFGLATLYTVATIRNERPVALALAAAGSLAGLVALGFLAQVFSLPTWGFALTYASLILGALAVGAVSMGMMLGHWYLVTPRLSEQPLRELTGFLLIVLVVQGVLIAGALALPHDTINGSVDTPILENPFFWMRVGFGLAFPALLVWMAYDSSGVHAMQSATGLLYIAMALVLCGEVVGKGVLFGSGVPN